MLSNACPYVVIAYVAYMIAAKNIDECGCSHAKLYIGFRQGNVLLVRLTSTAVRWFTCGSSYDAPAICIYAEIYRDKVELNGQGITT